MTVAVLVLTHVGAFMSGLLTMRVATVYFAREIEEHPVTTEHVATPPRGYHGWRWLAVGLVLLLVGSLGLWNSRQVKDDQACFDAYVSGAAPYAQAVQDTSQQLWDDFKKFQNIDPTDKRRIDVLRAHFFADLDKERAANEALQRYRRTHIPSHACP